MTLVYNRDIVGPKSHALVIGCGRFPHHRPEETNTPATVSGARQIVAFLIAQADTLIPPLATIEVVLSDPDAIAEEDRLGIGDFEHDPRQDDRVDPARRTQTDAAGRAWTDRCAAGDGMFFYMASHGVADRDMRAIGLLEDVFAEPNRRWHPTVNVGMVARGIPLLKAGSGWVFLDACQDVVREALEIVDFGASSLSWKEINLIDLVKTPMRAIGLAASRFGRKAYAPVDGSPPYFTQALLEGLRGACVQTFPQHGWAVGSRQLLLDLVKVSEAALDVPPLNLPEPITPNLTEVPLCTVAHPMIPVAVRTSTEADIRQASTVYAWDGGDRRHNRPDDALTWRFRLSPDGARYEVSAEFAQDGPLYASHAFHAFPSACIVTLEKIIPEP